MSRDPIFAELIAERFHGPTLWDIERAAAIKTKRSLGELVMRNAAGRYVKRKKRGAKWHGNRKAMRRMA